MQDKAKAKREADAKVGNTGEETAEKKKSSPFEPPYIEDLFVGELEGSQGEEGMAMLVSNLTLPLQVHTAQAKHRRLVSSSTRHVHLRGCICRLNAYWMFVLQ